MVFLTTKTTTKKQQDDERSTNVAAADSVNVDFSKMKIGQTRIPLNSLVKSERSNKLSKLPNEMKDSKTSPKTS